MWYPTAYLILVWIARFCVRPSSWEFLPPTLCIETWVLCSSRKQTNFLVEELQFCCSYGPLAAWNQFLILRIAPAFAARSGSAVSSSTEQLLTYRCLVLFTFFPLNSQSGTPSTPAFPGWPDSYAMGTSETHKTDCMLPFPASWRSVSLPEWLLL